MIRFLFLVVAMVVHDEFVAWHLNCSETLPKRRRVAAYWSRDFNIRPLFQHDGATPSFPGFSRFGPNDRLRPIGPICPARDTDSKVNGAVIRSQSQCNMDRMPILKKRQRLYPQEPCHHLPPVSSLSQHHQRSRPALQSFTPCRLGLRTLEAIAPHSA